MQDIDALRNEILDAVQAARDLDVGAANFGSNALMRWAWSWKALTLRSLEEPKSFLAKPSMFMWQPS